jgi:hypothetical protein
MAVTALLWGQIAAAHISHGFAIGTGALAAYLLGRSIHDIRHRRVRPWIGRGIAGSLLSVAGLLVAAGVLEARKRRTADQADDHRPEQDPGGGDGASRIDRSTDPVARPARPAVATRRGGEGAPPPAA